MLRSTPAIMWFLWICPTKNRCFFSHGIKHGWNITLELRFSQIQAKMTICKARVPFFATLNTSKMISPSAWLILKMVLVGVSQGETHVSPPAPSTSDLFASRGSRRYQTPSPRSSSCRSGDQFGTLEMGHWGGKNTNWRHREIIRI